MGDTERIDEIKDQLGKLWGSHRELAVVVHGANKDNGLRSDVRALEEFRAKQEAWNNRHEADVRHYLDIEREESCHGLAALKKHCEDHEENEEEEVAVKVAKIQTGGQTWVQVLTLIGVLGTALIALLK